MSDLDPYFQAVLGAQNMQGPRDVRREPNEHEINSAKRLIKIIDESSYQEKIVQFVAEIFRDWNLDIEERDEIIKMYYRTLDTRAVRAKRYRANHPDKVKEYNAKRKRTRSSTG